MKKIFQKTVFSLMLVSILPFARVAAQDAQSLNGTVLSNWGEPLPEVAISIEGSQAMPVVTDAEGKFTLEAESLDCWLIVSPIGEWRSRRIYVNSRDEVTIYLNRLDQLSDDKEVIVLEQKLLKRSLAVSFVDTRVEDHQYGVNLSLDEHMQGQVAGAYITDRSGDPGSGAMVNLRGVRSVFAGNQPLYIIDGIPLSTQALFQSNMTGYQYNALLGINSFDISQVTVMKDPVHGVAYGSKGSNGLVFVESLNPTATRTTIDVDLRTGLSLEPPKQIPQLDAVQHKTLMNEILSSSGLEEEVIREDYPGLFLQPDEAGYIDFQHNTNWQDYIFSNAMLYNLNVQVKGGDEIARYGLSFGYINSKGIVRNTGYDGYNLRFVSLLNIFTWLKMDASVGLNFNNAKFKESAIVSQTSPIISALNKSPLLNPYAYDAEDQELTILADVNELRVSNPLAVIENYEASNNNYNFTTAFGAEGRISPYMTLNARFSYNYNVLREQLFMPNMGMEAYYNDEAHNVAKAGNNSMRSIYNNNYLLYTKDFGDHSLSSNTGMHVLSNKYQFDWGLTKNAHANDEYRDLQDGQDNLREIGGANRNWNWLSFYENLSYSYKDKYLVNASLNLDASSRLGDDAAGTLNIGGNPFGIFYSAAFAWRVSSESFLKNASALEDLKLRVSYSHIGNDDIGESSALDYYEAVKFRETVGLYPALMANSTLSYELVNTINAGADLSLFGNRFMLNLDYYISNTSDMIVFDPIEAYFGYDYMIRNGGGIKNSGIELNTHLALIESRDFSWDLDLTFTKMNNEVTEIPGDKMIYTIPGGERVNMTGEAANSFYGYEFLGVYSDLVDVEEFGNLVNDKGIPYGPGDAIFSDWNGPNNQPDSIIDEFDKKPIGSPHPDFYGSVYTKVRYKRWSLSASLQYVVGHEIFNYVRYKNERMTDLANQSSNVLNRWQYDGQETNVPRAGWDDPMGNTSFSTRWIEPGDYLRLRNLTIAYTIPEKWAVFSNAEFYISANNLFTLTDYLGYDPEFSYSYSPVYQGVDYGLTPHPRQFLLGIKLGL